MTQSSPKRDDPRLETRACSGTRKIPYLKVEVKGTYREIGRAVGETARNEVVAAIGWYAENFKSMSGMDYSEATVLVESYLQMARQALPQYVEELEGMAEAAGVSLVDLAIPNCGEEFTWNPSTAIAGSRPMQHLRGCTAVAVAYADRHVVGHNMDWYAVDVDKNVLFDVTGPSGIRFVSFSGVPYLPATGFNSAGIAYIGNAVLGNDERIGVPNVLVRRWVVEAETIQDGCWRATQPYRSRGSNHFFVDASGAMVNLETSATASASFSDDSILVHTNHYMTDEMLCFECSFDENSRQRASRARDLLAEGVRDGADAVELVTAVLRDHAYAPKGICNHPIGDSEPTSSMTVGSLVCDMDNGRLYVCAGPPCSGEFDVYEL